LALLNLSLFWFRPFRLSLIVFLSPFADYFFQTFINQFEGLAAGRTNKPALWVKVLFGAAYAVGFFAGRA
jgi:hypothetical protein